MIVTIQDAFFNHDPGGYYGAVLRDGEKIGDWARLDKTRLYKARLTVNAKSFSAYSPRGLANKIEVYLSKQKEVQNVQQ